MRILVVEDEEKVSPGNPSWQATMWPTEVPPIWAAYSIWGRGSYHSRRLISEFQEPMWS